MHIDKAQKRSLGLCHRKNGTSSLDPTFRSNPSFTALSMYGRLTMMVPSSCEYVLGRIANLSGCKWVTQLFKILCQSISTK